MNDQKVDKRLKEIEDEIMLLSGHLSEAVEKKLGVKIGDLKVGLEKFQKSVLEIPAQKGTPAARPTVELNKLHSDLDTIHRRIGSEEFDTDDDNLARRLENFSGTIMKGLVGLESNVQNAVKQTSATQDVVKNTLIENLNKLNDAIENVCQTLTSDVEETLGSEFTAVKNRIEKLSEELALISGNVINGLESLETYIQDSVTQNEEKQEKTREALLQNLNNLNAAAETIQHMLTVDEDTTVISEITGIKNRIGELSEEVSTASGTINEELAALDTRISEITGIKTRIEELSEELSTGSGTIKDELSALDTRIQNTAERNTASYDEVKSILQQDLAKLNDSTEIIRRMVTTDEEKFLGSVTTMIHDNVQKFSEDLPALSGQINNRLVNMFKNAQESAKENLAKQEEVKKVLLYDLYKLNETTETIRQMCTTEEERPLGDEVIVMSDRMEQMAEQMPNITEKVNMHSDQLDKVSSEVIRMRWFVIGAVAISIIVLIASFFN